MHDFEYCHLAVSIIGNTTHTYSKRNCLSNQSLVRICTEPEQPYLCSHHESQTRTYDVRMNFNVRLVTLGKSISSKRDDYIRRRPAALSIGGNPEF